jgi:hypothetical protein
MARHHYLPRFYLANFTDPDAPSGPKRTPYLWVHTPAKGWEKRAPSNVAAKSAYYSIPGEAGELSEDVERMFSIAEGVAATIIRERILHERSPTLSERLELGGFIGLMHARLPLQIEHVGEFISGVGQRTVDLAYEMYKKHPEAWEAFKAKYRRDTGKSDFDGIRAEDLPDPREVGEVRAQHHAALAMSMSGAGLLGRVLPAMGWTFFVSRDAGYFITSDYPIGMADPVTKSDSPGLAFPGIEVTFPLSRSIALMMGWKNRGTTRWKLVTEQVLAEINYRTRMRASRLICPNPSFPGVDRLLDHTENEVASMKPTVLRLRQEEQGKDDYLVELTSPSVRRRERPK